jgi:hypothetical protein
MKIDEILAEMPKLTPEELDAIRAKEYELEVKAIKQRLEDPNGKVWPPQGDPEWDKFMEWIEAEPDDHLPDDLAHNHDRYWKRA